MPMEKHKYPKDWDRIALECKTRAEWTCAACSKKCRMKGEALEDFAERIGFMPDKPQQYTLTTAHIEPDPSNCSPSNLQALCSVCHLRHDHQQRKQLKRKKLYEDKHA